MEIMEMKDARYRIVTMTAVTSLLAAWAPIHAQDSTTDTHFSTSTTSDAPCPPVFTSVYFDDQLGAFFGRSQLTMAQWDEYHASQLYTYQFKGKTVDEKHGVTGIHHVASAQCTQAAFSYWLGVPGVIARLHNARFTSLACYSTGDTRLADYEYDPYEESSPEPGIYCPGNGGGGEGSGISYQPGDTTNGESVDWYTGKGNGGVSACGDKAVVEFACLDFYNEKTGNWDLYLCGYVTTC